MSRALLLLMLLNFLVLAIFEAIFVLISEAEFHPIVPVTVLLLVRRLLIFKSLAVQKENIAYVSF